MANTNRPLSPHLQIYRWEITMFLSILHRATGVALAAGAVLLTVWLYALFMTGTTLTTFYDFVKSPAGVLVCSGWLFSLCFHLLNGVRHLFWDFVIGVNSRAAKLSGWVTLIAAFVLTVVVWNNARGVYAQALESTTARPAVQTAPVEATKTENAQ
jgi:succinate dehydrogenase / fumarate reductase cytochrome b subunit